MEMKSSLSGKLVRSTEIKSGGDVFHEIFRLRPQNISDTSPNIQGCELHEGELATVGSVLYLNYIHEEKEKVAKDIIEVIDEEKQSIRFRIIEGDLMELCKIFWITYHVDTHGPNKLVTWTLEHEKLNENVEDPHTLMEFCLSTTKDIEAHHSI